jgi:hypothetical protein
MNAVRERLVTEAGALLLAPAFDAPQSEIGYITRYAPGLRGERRRLHARGVWRSPRPRRRATRRSSALLDAIQPATKDPERYWAEPYVLPGNVDGPDSPHHGRGGWTWYTGSAAWLHRIVSRVGARRAAGVGRAARRPVPAAGVERRADDAALARRNVRESRSRAAAAPGVEVDGNVSRELVPRRTPEAPGRARSP